MLVEIASAVSNTVQWASETGASLGGVINCAGVGTAAKIIDAHGKAHSLDLWEFAIAVNLTGSFNLTRLVLEHLVKVEPEAGTDGERGIVVFVASAAAVSHYKFCSIYPILTLCCYPLHSSKVNQDRQHTQLLKALCAR